MEGLRVNQKRILKHDATSVGLLYGPWDIPDVFGLDWRAHAAYISRCEMFSVGVTSSV